MILSMSGQAALFLAFAAVGFGCALLYDVLRAFRRLFRHPPWATQAEDALFWAASTGALFYALLLTGGAMRGFVLLGAFLGMALCFAGVSPTIVRFITTAGARVKQKARRKREAGEKSCGRFGI